MCRHLLPNFYECWWDHVVLDVMGMNLLGIVAGWWVIKRWNLERLKWSMREGPLKKGIGWNARQFVMSGDVSQVEYKMMTNTKKFLQVSWFIIFVINPHYTDATRRPHILLQQVPPQHPTRPIHQRHPYLDDGSTLHKRQQIILRVYY